MKRSRPRTLTAEEREQAAVFRAFVTPFDGCAVCGGGQCEAHHVVEAQELRNRGLPVYEPENALALCRGCHERHTNASRRVPFRKLRPENISYAYEVLGDFASDYLRRRYPMDETEEQL